MVAHDFLLNREVTETFRKCHWYKTSLLIFTDMTYKLLGSYNIKLALTVLRDNTRREFTDYGTRLGDAH